MLNKSSAALGCDRKGRLAGRCFVPKLQPARLGLAPLPLLGVTSSPDTTARLLRPALLSRVPRSLPEVVTAAKARAARAKRGSSSSSKTADGRHGPRRGSGSSTLKLPPSFLPSPEQARAIATGEASPASLDGLVGSPVKRPKGDRVCFEGSS